MNLVRTLAERTMQLLLVLLSVTLVVFALTKLAPGDPARLRLGPRASEESVFLLQEQMGLHQSLPRQYFGYW
jgi:peptide/nickel transport system permease protein